uniref:NAD-specific glutamate dehydrogenase n=1 Tax=Parastrongyloides trichosuri TaxID=131310 RepID=A0A0N5A088_PARTI
MGVDLAQGAVVAQFGQLLDRQGLQLVFRHGEVFGDLLRRAGRAVGVARGEGGFTHLEQVQFLEQVDEGLGACALLLEVVAELHAEVDVAAGLAVFEQGRLAAFDHEGGGAVDAQHHALLLFVIGEDEGVAADIGRDIGVGAEVAVLDEQVLGLVQAHGGDRLLGVADEDDRIGQGGRGELRHRQRHDVGLGHEGVGLVRGRHAQLAVHVSRQRLGLGIEQDSARQGAVRLGRVGHEIGSSEQKGRFF